jgi:hypothetical protein
MPTVEATVGLERFLPLLEYLEDNKDQLKHLLQTVFSHDNCPGSAQGV